MCSSWHVVEEMQSAVDSGTGHPANEGASPPLDQPAIVVAASIRTAPDVFLSTVLTTGCRLSPQGRTELLAMNYQALIERITQAVDW